MAPTDSASPELSPELSVVVPVKNEAENLAPLIDEIGASLSGAGIDHEIVYVDDGSTDETPKLLAGLKAQVPALRVVRLGPGCGQSTAIVAGVRHARAPVVATLDGDGQNDPADIPALLARYKEEAAAGPVLIAGHRTTRRDNWLRRVSSKIANGVRGWLLKDDTPDTACGFKVFGHDDFLGFPAFDHMHRFLPALMIRAGGRAVSVPVNHRPRERGTSKYGVWNRLWVGIVDMFGVMWLARRPVRPKIIPTEPDPE